MKDSGNMRLTARQKVVNELARKKVKETESGKRNMSQFSLKNTRLKTKIIAAIVACCMIVSGLSVTLVWIRTARVTEADVRQYLFQTAANKGNAFQVQTNEIESVVSCISSIAVSTLNPTKVSDDTYMQGYIDNLTSDLDAIGVTSWGSRKRFYGSSQ